MFEIPDGPLALRVAGARQDRAEIISTHVPGVARDTVACLKGAAAWIELPEDAPTDLQTVHPAELDGMQVQSQRENPVGVVSEVYVSGLSGAIEVTKPDGSSVMLPVIPQVIARVDRERGLIIVNDIAPYAVEEHAD